MSFQCESVVEPVVQLCEYGCGNPAIKIHSKTNKGCCSKHKDKCPNYNSYVLSKSNNNISSLPLCHYGCGKTAIKFHVNTKIWCCSKKSEYCSNYTQYLLKEQENLLEVTQGRLCDYGCDKPAIKFHVKQNLWCCSKKHNDCCNYVNYLNEYNKYVFDVISGNIYQPCCYGCGKQARFLLSHSKLFCCSKHHKGCDVIKNRTEKTNLIIYGETYATKTQKMKDKTKETNKKRYGVEYPQQNPQVKNKSIQTTIVRYGVDNPAKLQENKDKVKATNKERYGVEVPRQNEDIYNKIKDTMIERYGVEQPMHSQELIDRMIKSKIDKGIYRSEDILPEQILYYKKVGLETERNFRQYGNIIIGDLDIKRSKEFHLDHIFSKNQGYEQGIAPEIIGHWTNLRLLHHSLNESKRNRCDKTKEQLLEDYRNNI